MSDLMGELKQLSGMRDKLTEMMGESLKLSIKVAEDVNSRYREELHSNGGSMQGLEDFYVLNQILRKNTASLKNACELVRRMKPTTGYDVSEDAIEDMELKALLSK